LFTRAIVRPPGSSFSSGLTTVDLGKPHLAKALAQHQLYCEALKSCGLSLTVLPADARYPDSTFVEDTAVLLEHCAVVTRPGAESRRGEVESIKPLLSEYFQRIREIKSPGRVDGGDVCEAGNHFFIGISNRTNEEGARQLAEILRDNEYTSEFVDIRNINSILHLKSGLAYLGGGQLVVIDALISKSDFKGFKLIRVNHGEEYASNCVAINQRVLIAAGYPMLCQQLSDLGHDIVEIEMSEFQKMDGGLSCLSLRF
jgi:dimethylargininase